MFLRDVAADITVFFKTLDERGFPRAARTNDANE
jgi:hypothetical protein